MSHKVTPKQRQAIYLLASGMTAVEVAKKIKVRREMISRWKRLPEFNEELESVVEELCCNTKHHVKRLVDEALRTVHYGITSDYCGEQRLKTAFSVLKMLGLEQILLPESPKTVGQDAHIAHKHT